MPDERDGREPFTTGLPAKYVSLAGIGNERSSKRWHRQATTVRAHSSELRRRGRTTAGPPNPTPAGRASRPRSTQHHKGRHHGTCIAFTWLAADIT